MKPLSTPWNALVSYHYFKGEAEQALIARGHAAGIRWIGDSGAFSAHTSGNPIDRDAYAEWLHRNSRYFAWCASLDVIGNADGSWRNFQALTRQGFNVVPTVHFGTPAKELDKYADAGATLVGLGGVAALRNKPAILRWFVSMFKHARDNHPDMRFHGWGVTHRDYLAHLPFWSVDSSGFGQGFRFGRAALFDPVTARRTDFDLDGRSPGKYGRLLREHYGITPREIATSHAGNRQFVLLMGAHTAQHMSRYYTARHKVTPPPGWEADGLGTHIHFADTGDAFKRVLNHMAEYPETPTTEEQSA